MSNTNGRNGRNGKGKRGPGRPPGPCKTPYRRSGAGPLKIGQSHMVGVPEPTRQFDLTKSDEQKIRRYALAVDVSQATLLQRARTGDVEARMLLRDRFGLTLPLVEAAQANLCPCQVLSGAVDARSLVGLGTLRAAYTLDVPWTSQGN